ncbi:MAG: 2-hydroxyacyl-CoA dehydratase family protein [Rhodospirillaceae bacterium]|nr:2-hydroxyacyl-CoA dehydratase family protein [Rhodospirillaceae bacterium]MEA4838108.1 2-hydroxyacyl-CoA dehydratase family protein [Rhodospirillaceae bacterium]
MNAIAERLGAFRAVADRPAEAPALHKARTGKGAIGVFPVYAPEEIVHASGFLPVGLWGGSVRISRAQAFLPSFACSIMQSVMELELKGTYDDLTAVLISSPCDTLKCMGQKWKGKCPSIQFVQPQNRELESANLFLVEEYKLVRSKLEAIIGEAISDEAISASIAVYNRNRQAMREFVGLAAIHPDLISPVDRHAVVKSRYFMDKALHTEWVEGLSALLRAQPVRPWSGKKVLLTGITAEPNALLDILAENGFAVAADDLAHESRQFRHDVPEGNEPLYRLARWWQLLDGCSLATSRTKNRVSMLLDMVKAGGIDAVIVCMMKFCDPEEFDYPLIYQALQENRIKNTIIEIDQGSESFEQIRTRLQGFAENI